MFRIYKHYLISKFSAYESFWRIRTLLIRLRFSFTKIIFQLKIRLSEARFETSIFRSLISTNIAFSIIAILMGLLALFVINRFIADSHQTTFSWSSLIEVIPPESTTAYDGLLIGIVTVIGIFLTLYLTNINTAAGTVYAKFPTNIRRLYARERVGNLYIRYLIFLLLLCLVFLGAAVVLELRSKLVMILTVLLSLSAIHPFLSLGSRSFELFDPTSLGTNFFMEFIEWSQRASENRYWAFDKSFQYHFHKQAESSLNGVATLIKISWDEAYLRDQPFMSLLGHIPRLFNNYLGLKRRIPTKSLWFLQKPKYDYWYLAPSNAVGIAASTQTDIVPKIEFDTRWVETLLLQYERESLSKCLAQERHYDVATILDHLNTMVSKLGREWDVEYACTALIAIKNDVINIAPLKIDKGILIESSQALREKIGVVDYLGLLPISLFLEFQKNIVRTQLEKLSDQLGHLEWEKTQSIYTLNLPFLVLDRLEFVQERLAFEIEAEGKIVSAHWYIKQLVFQAIATLIQDQIQSLLNKAQNIYNTVDYFTGKQNYLYAATLSIRGLEFYSKISYLLEEIIKQWETLGISYVEKSIPWPTDKWAAIRESFSAAERTLLVKYAKLIPFLSQIEKRDEMPDYFGRAVHVLGEQCFKALQKNQSDDFKELFPFYFMGSLSEHDILRKATQDWQVEQKLLALSGPVIDLCHLSGYALFFAEFHQNGQLWIECKTLWDKYLAENGKEKLGVLAAFIAYESNLFAITDRGLLRTNWEMAIKNLIRTLPRKSIPIRSLPFPDLASKVDHSSPLIQTMGGSQDWVGSPYDGGDIFVELHLKTLEACKGLDFGRSKNLVESLAKRRKRKRKLDGPKK